MYSYSRPFSFYSKPIIEGRFFSFCTHDQMALINQNSLFALNFTFSLTAFEPSQQLTHPRVKQGDIFTQWPEYDYFPNITNLQLSIYQRAKARGREAVQVAFPLIAGVGIQQYGPVIGHALIVFLQAPLTRVVPVVGIAVAVGGLLYPDEILDYLLIPTLGRESYIVQALESFRTPLEIPRLSRQASRYYYDAFKTKTGFHFMTPAFGPMHEQVILVLQQWDDEVLALAQLISNSNHSQTILSYASAEQPTTETLFTTWLSKEKKGFMDMITILFHHPQYVKDEEIRKSLSRIDYMVDLLISLGGVYETTFDFFQRGLLTKTVTILKRVKTDEVVDEHELNWVVRSMIEQGKIPEVFDENGDRVFIWAEMQVETPGDLNLTQFNTTQVAVWNGFQAEFALIRLVKQLAVKLHIPDTNGVFLVDDKWLEYRQRSPLENRRMVIEFDRIWNQILYTYKAQTGVDATETLKTDKENIFAQYNATIRWVTRTQLELEQAIHNPHLSLIEQQLNPLSFYSIKSLPETISQLFPLAQTEKVNEWIQTCWECAEVAKWNSTYYIQLANEITTRVQQSPLYNNEPAYTQDFGDMFLLQKQRRMEILTHLLDTQKRNLGKIEGAIPTEIKEALRQIQENTTELCDAMQNETNVDEILEVNRIIYDVATPEGLMDIPDPGSKDFDPSFWAWWARNKSPAEEKVGAYATDVVIVASVVAVVYGYYVCFPKPGGERSFERQPDGSIQLDPSAAVEMITYLESYEQTSKSKQVLVWLMSFAHLQSSTNIVVRTYKVLSRILSRMSSWVRRESSQTTPTQSTTEVEADALFMLYMYLSSSS